MSNPFADELAKRAADTTTNPFAAELARRSVNQQPEQGIIPSVGRIASVGGQAFMESEFNTGPESFYNPEKYAGQIAKLPGILQPTASALAGIGQAGVLAARLPGAIVHTIGSGLNQAQREVTGEEQAGLGTAAELAAVELGRQSSVNETPMTAPKYKAPSSKLEPGAAVAEQLLPGQIPAQKLTTSPWMDAASNIAESSILGGGRMRKAGEKAADAARGLIDQFAQQWTTNSKEHVGEIVQNAVSDSADLFKQAARGAYKAVDDAMNYETNGAYQGIVDMRPIKEEVVKIFGEIKGGLPSTTTGYGFLNDLLQKPDFVSFEDAQLIRSDLLGIGRNITETIPGRGQTYSKRLSPLMDQSMEQAATNVGPEALRTWRDANALWKDGIENFNSNVIKAIANKDPESVYGAAVRNGLPGTIRRVRDIVSKSNPDAWKSVQGQYLQDLIAKSSDKADGTIDGQKLLGNINEAKRNGTLQEVFTDPDTVQYMGDLAQTLRLAQKGNTLGGFKLRTTISNAGFVPELYAVYQLSQGKGIVTNGAILLTPTALSLMLTKPALRGFLLKGINEPAGSIKGQSAIRNLLSGLAASGAVDLKQNPTDNLNRLNAAQQSALSGQSLQQMGAPQ